MSEKFIFRQENATGAVAAELSAKEWADKVLPAELERVWHNKEALARLLEMALSAGLGRELSEGAKRLEALDPQAERTAVVSALVLARSKKLPEAEKVLRTFLESSGETGVVLTNLAKIEAERGDEERAYATLERAIALEPNQENGLAWFAALSLRLKGPIETVGRLRALADAKDSWRPQLALAELELSRGELASAKQVLRAVLERRGFDFEIVQHVAVIFGRASQPEALVELLESRYEVREHDPQVGLLVVHALLALGRTDDAARLRRKIQRVKAAVLAGEVRDGDRARQGHGAGVGGVASGIGASKAANEVRSIAVLPIVGPLWSTPLGRPEPLIEVRPEGKLFGLVPFASAERSLLSRALPLFFAELFAAKTDSETLTLLPYVHGAGAFVSGERWSLETMLQMFPLNLTPEVVITGVVERGSVKIEIYDLVGETQTELKIVEKNEGAIALALGEGLLAHLERSGHLHRLEHPREEPGWSAKNPPERYLAALDVLALEMIARRANLAVGPAAGNTFQREVEALLRGPGLAPKLLAIAGAPGDRAVRAFLETEMKLHPDSVIGRIARAQLRN